MCLVKDEARPYIANAVLAFSKPRCAGLILCPGIGYDWSCPVYSPDLVPCDSSYGRILLVYLYLAKQGELTCTMPEQLPSTQVSLILVVKIFLKNLYFTLGIILYTKNHYSI
jgi:hypothetical protein